MTLIEEMPRTAFSLWINRKYSEFRDGKVGHDAGISAFGRLFGAPHQVVLGWFKDDAQPPRALKYINRMIDTYGEEAYEPLGIDKLNMSARQTEMDRKLKEFMELIEQVPDDKRDELISLVKQFLEFAGFHQINP